MSIIIFFNALCVDRFMVKFGICQWPMPTWTLLYTLRKKKKKQHTFDSAIDTNKWNFDKLIFYFQYSFFPKRRLKFISIIMFFTMINHFLLYGARWTPSRNTIQHTQIFIDIKKSEHQKPKMFNFHTIKSSLFYSCYSVCILQFKVGWTIHLKLAAYRLNQIATKCLRSFKERTLIFFLWMNTFEGFWMFFSHS